MKQLVTYIVALIIVEAVVCISFNPSFSNRPELPRGSRFVQIPNNVGLNNVNGHIAYFGDFNSDKFSDIFIIDATRTKGSFWLWSTANWQFEQLTSSEVTSEGSEIILDVIATDFNRDGKLDLLVQTGNETSPKNVRLFLYFGNTTHFTSHTELSSSVDVVSLIDYNGDLFPDLIGSYTANNATKLSVWLNNKEGETTFSVQDFSSTALTLASGSAVGFVDLNGDCMPDLFIPVVGADNVTNYDVWLNGPKEFTYARTIKGLTGVGSPSFADFDGDGTTDILFPYCATSSCAQPQLIVLYNTQLPVCSAEVTKNCRSLEALCQADENWAVTDVTTTPSSTVTVTPVPVAFANSTHFPTRVIRVGDVDLDGFPDLLINVIDASSGARRIALYHNVQCTGDLGCVDAAVSAKRRAFTELTTGTEALTALHGAFAAAFFDLDDDGTNDILVLSESDAPASSVARNITALFNNYDNDAYFLKMIALSGVCINWCRDAVAPDPKPYGVNQHGAIFKWTATDLDNIRRVVQVSQLTQSSYLSLQPPYFFGGLGRPSNYVDYLYMGLSVRNSEDRGSTMFWTGLIPNSQVVTIPYPPDEPLSWTAELYVSPGSYVVWITIAVVAWLVAVGIVIIILQVREKREDNKAKKEREHLFSFKAL